MTSTHTQPVVLQINGWAKWITLVITLLILLAGWVSTATTMRSDIKHNAAEIGKNTEAIAEKVSKVEFQYIKDDLAEIKAILREKK